MPRGVAWSKEDDLELCHAWLAICSEDTSSRRRPPELFARMHEYIVERSNRPTRRSTVALVSRWKKISAILSLLDAAVARAIAVKPPNVVDDIVILDELAAIPVEKLGAVDRRGVLACWRLLRNTPAWCRFLRLPHEPATDDDANDHTEEAPAKRAKRSPDATPPRTSFLTIAEANNARASPTSEPTIESTQSSNTSSEVPNTSSEVPAMSSTEPVASSTEPAASMTEPPALSEEPSTTPPPAAVSAPATTSERSATTSTPRAAAISEPPAAAISEAPGRNRPAAARFREVGHRIPPGAYSLAPHPSVPQAAFRPPETVYRQPETVYRHPDASSRFAPGTRHVGVGAPPMGPRSLPPDVVRYQEGTSPPSLWPNAECSPWPPRGSVMTPSTEMHVQVLSERNQLDEWTFMARVFEHDPDAPDAIEFRRLLRSSMLQRARQLHANGNSFLDPRSTNDGNVHV